MLIKGGLSGLEPIERCLSVSASNSMPNLNREMKDADIIWTRIGDCGMEIGYLRVYSERGVKTLLEFI